MRVLASILLALIPVVTAAGQNYLPESLGSWNRSSARVAPPPEDSSLLQEYGLVRSEYREYYDGRSRLGVALYQMRDPSGAYGAYTSMLDDSMAPADLAHYSSISASRALIVVGHFVLEITGNLGEARPGDLKRLSASLAPRVSQDPFPAIQEYFPERGRIRNSQRYMLGPLALSRFLPLSSRDWLGFAGGAEAQLSRYRLGGREATLLLVLYPTPQAAAEKLEELRQNVSVGGEESDSLATNQLFARRKGSLLALVANASSKQAASALLNQIRYETSVTWNEPGYSLNDPSIAEILVGTIVGTGIILLFALVAGIGFGGIRILVKYLLPGKVFDRPGNLEILQLGLSSKPIEAKDFY